MMCYWFTKFFILFSDSNVLNFSLIALWVRQYCVCVLFCLFMWSSCSGRRRAQNCRPDQMGIKREMKVVMSEQAQQVLPTGMPHTVVLCRLIRKHCSLQEAGSWAWLSLIEVWTLRLYIQKHAVNGLSVHMLHGFLCRFSAGSVDSGHKINMNVQDYFRLSW